MSDRAKIPAPEQGIYEDVPFDEYIKWDAISYSTLVQALPQAPRSGKRMREFRYVNGKPEPVVSMKLLKAFFDGRLPRPGHAVDIGTAIHVRCLEPNDYATRIVVSKSCEQLLKSGPRKGEPCGYSASKRYGNLWFCGTHAPPEAEEVAGSITEAEAAAVEEMVESIKHYDTLKLFKAAGGVETCVVWDTEVMYLVGEESHSKTMRMKSRLDKHIPSPRIGIPPTILDLKSVGRGGYATEAWEREVETYCYDIQAAMYSDAIKAVQGVLCNYLWAIVERDVPYDMVIRQAEGDTIDLGRWYYRGILKALAVAQDTNEWHGIEERSVLAGGVSRWMIKRHEEVLKETA